MSRIVKTLLAVAILASVASVASAITYPPGPPYRSCPDSVTIFQLQQKDTLLNPCLPALTDTVLGVRGVIVGFRPRSTGRIYIMNSNGADWNGVEIYTQSVHYENLGYAIGDSISIPDPVTLDTHGLNETAVANRRLVARDRLPGSAEHQLGMLVHPAPGPSSPRPHTCSLSAIQSFAVLRRAAPRPLFRRLYQPCPDRIVFNIAGAGQQIALVHHKRRKPALPQIPLPAFSKIDPERIPPVRLSYGPPQALQI